MIACVNSLVCLTFQQLPNLSVTMTTIVHDTTEAVCLSAEYNLYLKPIAKMTVSVALPQLKLPGKSISNWEVMERVKAMVAPEQFSVLRISKSTMDFIRFEGEVENKTVVKGLLSRLDGKSIKLSGFTDVLKVKLSLQLDICCLQYLPFLGGQFALSYINTLILY